MIGLLKFKKAAQDLAGEFNASLAAVRRQIEAKQEERRETETWLVPEADAVAAAERWVDDLEARYDLPVGGFATGRPGNHPSFGPQNGVPLLVGLLFGACRDQVLGHIRDMISDYYDGRPSGTAQEKAKRLEQLDAEILDLEIAEERLVRSGEEAGILVQRREDADPAVVTATDESLAA